MFSLGCLLCQNAIGEVLCKNVAVLPVTYYRKSRVSIGIEHGGGAETKDW